MYAIKPALKVTTFSIIATHCFFFLFSHTETITSFFENIDRSAFPAHKGFPFFIFFFTNWLSYA